MSSLLAGGVFAVVFDVVRVAVVVLYLGAAGAVLLQLRQLSAQLVQLRIEIARRLIGALQLLRLFLAFAS